MKIQLLLLAAFASLSTLANTDSTQLWTSVARAFHGTTNQVKGITADGKGNVYYSGYGYEINPGNRHGLIVGKMDDTLNYVWKTHFFGFPENSGYHQILSNDSNLFIIGEFKGTLEIPNDTLRTANNTNPERFFVCLNTKNGAVRWARNLGYREDPKMEFDGNNDLVLSYSALSGPQTYDGQVIGTVNTTSNFVRGYAYLTLNSSDGTLINQCFGIQDILANQNQNYLDGRNVKSFVLTRRYTSSWQFTVSHRLRNLDLNTNTITTSADSVIILGNNVVIRNMIYHPQDKSMTLFISHGALAIFGADTIKSPVNTPFINFRSVVKLDSTFKLVKHFSYPQTPFGVEFQNYNDTNIVFSFGADGDGFIFKGDGQIDTIPFTGVISAIHKGYFIARCNLNFQNFTYLRYSVDNNRGGWQTGMSMRGLDIDQNGNIYGAAFHENDIVAVPDTIRAFNKSWQHLSVVSKYGMNGIGSNPVSLKENILKNKIIVYPNPATNQLNIDTKVEMKNAVIFDLTGKIVATAYTNQIDISSLTPGVYYIRIELEGSVQTAKFIKQ